MNAPNDEATAFVRDWLAGCSAATQIAVDDESALIARIAAALLAERGNTDEHIRRLTIAPGRTIAVWHGDANGFVAALYEFGNEIAVGFDRLPTAARAIVELLRVARTRGLLETHEEAL